MMGDDYYDDYEDEEEEDLYMNEQEEDPQAQVLGGGISANGRGKLTRGESVGEELFTKGEGFTLIKACVTIDSVLEILFCKGHTKL